jgi:hypothetical protein
MKIRNGEYTDDGIVSEGFLARRTRSVEAQSLDSAVVLSGGGRPPRHSAIAGLRSRPKPIAERCRALTKFY